MPLGPSEATDEWFYPDFVDLRDADTGIAMTAWAVGQTKTSTPTPSGIQKESVRKMFVSSNYFSSFA